MEFIHAIWFILMMPFCWALFLFQRHQNESKEFRAAIWHRIHEINTTLNSVKFSVDSVEDAFITNTDVSVILKKEFTPVLLEYERTVEALNLISKNLNSLEKEIIKLSDNQSE